MIKTPGYGIGNRALGQCTFKRTYLIAGLVHVLPAPTGEQFREN